jgi:hypothetical protein
LVDAPAVFSCFFPSIFSVRAGACCCLVDGVFVAISILLFSSAAVFLPVDVLFGGVD